MSPRDRSDRTVPYVVSQRIRDAIDRLAATPGAAVDGAERPLRTRPLVGVVSDAPSLRAFLACCFRRDYGVLVASTVGELAKVARNRRLALIAADLYTLEHQRPGDLHVLSRRYADLPLLIAAQEAVPMARRLSRDVLRARTTALPLPTDHTTMRRVAAALIQSPSSGATASAHDGAAAPR